MEAEWPKNVLHHVLTNYHQRNSFIGSLSRSRTSLNLITPNMDRRRSISPLRGSKSAAASASSTTKRGKLTKAQRYGSVSNLKLVSEKISGFSVFTGGDVRREPIMAYGDDPTASSDSGSDRLATRRSVERQKPLDKKKLPKLNRQSMSEQLFHKLNESVGMKRSISQQNLKQDIALEAVVIDLPSIDGKDMMESCSTDSREGSDFDVDAVSSKFSRWGAIRGSNSYSDSVPVGQLSTLNLRASLASNRSNEQPDSAV